MEKKRSTEGDGGFYYLLNGNQRFKDGYLVKPVAVKSLVLEEALPPLDELQRFNQVPLARCIMHWRAVTRCCATVGACSVGRSSGLRACLAVSYGAKGAACKLLVRPRAVHLAVHGAAPERRPATQVGAAARAEGDATPGGELAQLVESLAGDGDAAAAAALRFSKDDKARSCSSS